MCNAEGIKSEFIQDMIVGQPAFMEGLDKITAAESAATLKALMEWDVITSSAAYLTDEIRECNFNFFGKTMSGRKEDYPLWKRAVNQVQSQMGEPLGRMYCKRYFPESSKKIMQTLVKNLQISLGQRIDAQTWMSDTTKLPLTRNSTSSMSRSVILTSGLISPTWRSTQARASMRT